MTDWSAHEMAGILHQVQEGKLGSLLPRVGSVKSYEANYHSSRGASHTPLNPEKV